MKAGMSPFGPRLQRYSDSKSQARVHLHLDPKWLSGSTCTVGSTPAEESAAAAWIDDGALAFTAL